MKPSYTPEAKAAKIQGNVLLEAVVLEDGTVDAVKVVVSADERFGLDNEAVKAARQWVFKSGTKDGKPVAVRIMIELTVTLTLNEGRRLSALLWATTGLLGIATNVHEWCADWHEADYYSRSPERNPAGPDHGVRRVARGGAWRHAHTMCRVTLRSKLDPSFRYNDFGFRLARSL